MLGICGGYQMLGHNIHDPDGIEGSAGTSGALGLLDIETTMTPKKRLAENRATHTESGEDFLGYEIHIGRSDGPDRERPFAQVDGRKEGAISPSGLVEGSYFHGMFRDDGFRRAYLSKLGAKTSEQSYSAGVEKVLELLADHMEAHLDVDGLLGLAR